MAPLAHLKSQKRPPCQIPGDIQKKAEVKHKRHVEEVVGVSPVVKSHRRGKVKAERKYGTKGKEKQNYKKELESIGEKHREARTEPNYRS
ncbi:hypothetical protein Pcinc_003637 [Petrolisthes cinctipes]|uniref:Uncharacterized protein n=1 Tax=Petrolisthes cinctipes TaxID=88211 RepID=A0AAE1GHE6_PETCI|nr:hypothetical protein Pcinc_003637 [Petrolisthes cinctipes]